MSSDILEKRKTKFTRMRMLRDRDAAQGKPKVTGQEADPRIAHLEDLFVICPECGESFLKEEVRKNYYTCPHCKHLYTMPVEKRLRSIADDGSIRVFASNLEAVNPLHFPGYEEKIAQQREKSGQAEAIYSAVCKIDGRDVAVVIMNSKFLMGSMGILVGEYVTRACEYAGIHKIPLVIFTASGGARMQEGMLSLMQMAKTSAAIEKFKRAGGLYIVVYTHPTTGGVSASFAGLGDITLAEPGALVGFAGPRVIEQTIGEKLPEGFQKAEYLEEHGFVDQVVERERLREVLSRILKLHA